MAHYRKLHITAYLLFITLLALTVAYAGEYHAIKEKTKGTNETIVCSQCHTMHESQGNQSLLYSGGGSGPQVKLLRYSSIMGLCLFCHNNNKAGFSCAAGTPCPPDVWTGVTNFTNHSAGLLCNGGSTADIACSTALGANNHTLDTNITVTVPGSSPAITLAGFTCVNCHNPHGTYSYRNLRDNGTVYAPPGSTAVTYMAAGETITYSMSATRSAAVNVNNLVAAGYGLAKYQTNNVVFKQIPTTNTAGIQGFCRSCHTLFHGASGDTNMSSNTGLIGDDLATPNPWLRHPTRGRDIASAAADLHADSACWTDGTTAKCAQAFGGWARAADPDASAENTGTAQPFCLTCHRAHGSTNHSNLIFGAPTTTGGAGTMMRQTCQQCHNQ